VKKGLEVIEKYIKLLGFSREVAEAWWIFTELL